MRQTALLIDDDACSLRSLASLLRQLPLQVLTARGAEEAVWTLQTCTVDLLIATSHSPGKTFLDWVAQRHPGVTRLVAVGHASAPAASGQRRNAQCDFAMPCADADFLAAVRHAISQRSVPLPSAAFSAPGVDRFAASARDDCLLPAALVTA